MKTAKAKPLIRRPIIKYFGSKWNTSKHYPAPRYNRIIEPFAGSACYALHYPQSEVILYDIDPDMVRLWNYLINVSPEEILSLPCGDELVRGQDLRDICKTWDQANLIRRWQRTGHNTCWTVSGWNNLGGCWTPSCKVSIAESVQHIRHWKAICSDYRSIPLEEATWFIDPPYQHVRGYSFDCRGMDYTHLADWIRALPGQVIVCEQQGADWLPFVPFRTISAGQASVFKPGSKSHEVIYAR